MAGKDKMIWRKAAVLGSIWAASEIVLGSFLHNVRAPFSGEILTAIGIAVLVAGHRLWPERGLLWRAGIVCAIMKSISPSAVLLGPMIAIAMEGLLVEAGIRLPGAGRAGYIIGGGLAMTWALAQKAANLLLFYGPDTVKIYLRGADWLRANLGFGAGDPWTPLIPLTAIYFLYEVIVTPATGDHSAAIAVLNAAMPFNLPVLPLLAVAAFMIAAGFMARIVALLISVLVAGTLTTWGSPLSLFVLLSCTLALMLTGSGMASTWQPEDRVLLERQSQRPPLL